MKSLPSKTPAPALITFGRGGHTVYFAPQEQHGATTRQRTSGYRSPENFFAERPSHRPDGPVSRDYDPMDFQGCPVIDMRAAAGTPAGVRMAISGPMVEPGLADREVAKCPVPSAMLAEGLGATGFAPLVALNEVQRANNVRAGSLDTVSVPEYIRMWRMAGAKIGAVRGVAIQFEEPAKVVPGPTEEQDEMLLGDAGALKAPVIAEEKKVLAAQGPVLEG